MHSSKTYICLELGEHHPALCVLVKDIHQIGDLKPKIKVTYEIRTLETFPEECSFDEIFQRIKQLMKAYVMGDVRFILGKTFIRETTEKSFAQTSLKPVKISITGEKKSFKDNFVDYVPYSELLEKLDEL